MLFPLSHLHHTSVKGALEIMMHGLLASASRRLAAAAEAPHGSLAAMFVHGIFPRAASGAFLLCGTYMLFERTKRLCPSSDPHPTPPFTPEFLPIFSVSLRASF
jgi:hypothetical protein